MYFLALVWADILALLNNIFSAGMAMLDALSDAVSTNLFLQLFFGVVVFSIASFIILKVVTIVKKIAGAK
jgi:hypothetical protein